MWSSIDVLGGLIPNCRCGAAFDLGFCAPHTLPCAHTFCLMCLSKEEQRKRRKCPSCQKKYSSFILNVTLAEVVERVRQRRDWMDGQSRRCDECESRYPVTALRRCLTCIRGIGKHVSAGCTLDCVICLECCVDRHNGHEMISLPVRSLPPTVCPVASSTPLLRKPRYIDGIASTSNCQTKGCINTRLQAQHCTYSSMKNDQRRVSVAVSSTEKIVCMEESPLYYQLPIERLSESMSDFSRSSSANRIVCEDPQEIFYRKDSSASTCSTSSSTDASVCRNLSMYCSSKIPSATKYRHQDAQCVSISASFFLKSKT